MAEESDDGVMRELLKRQTKALEALARHFAPRHMEENARRWRIFIAKIVAFSGIGMSAMLGGWECVQYMIQQWDIRQMANRYAEVAKEIYYNENNAEVATQFLTKAVELEDNDAGFRYLPAYMDGMGVVRRLMNLDRPLTKEEVDLAHKAVANAILLKGLSSNRPEPYILQGQVYAALNEDARAMDELKQAIKLDKKNEFAHTRMAVLLAKENKVDEAMAELETALKLNPQSKWAWLWKGVVFADNRKDWDNARQAYAKALEIDPRFDLAFYNLGWTYVKQEPPDYKQARDQFEKAFTINPNYKEAYYGMGMVYGYQNQYEIAGLYFDKALNIDKNFLTAWKWHGIVRAEQERYDDALNDFSKAIELAPSMAELYVRRARIYDKTDKTDKAVADLQFDGELKPNDKQTWLYLGDVFLKINELDKAMGHYAQAIKTDAKYADAYAQIAKVWVKRGNTEEALKALDKAVENASQRPERFLLDRGKVLQQSGAMDKALADFNAACAANDKMPEAFFAKAQVLEQMKDKEGALKAVNAFIELRPTDAEGQDLRKSIESM